LRLIPGFVVLHCDKVSWFGHIQAPPVRFAVPALIVSSDNGLNAAAICRSKKHAAAAKHGRRQADVVMGSFARMGVDQARRAFALGALLASALALGGCSTPIADLPMLGTPADAPSRPKEAGAYLPVHDLPPDRAQPELAPAERAKIQAELLAARDRQASAAAAKAPAAKQPSRHSADPE
jgi:hypothetical protein